MGNSLFPWPRRRRSLWDSRSPDRPPPRRKASWRHARASGKTPRRLERPGGSPGLLSQCRSRQSSAASPSGGFASAPAPAPAPQSGSSFPWWQPSNPASTPASNAGSAAAVRADQYTTELQARARCPSDTVVWVNTSTRVYHYADTRYYGRTHRGAYMCEADARAGGYRAARNREREAQAHSG